MPAETFEYWPLIVSGCTGGLMGSIITAFVNEWRSKKELAIRTVEQFLMRQNEFSNCTYLLRDKFEDEDDINKIIELANWCEIVAVLYSKGHVDKSLVDDFGIIEILLDFYFEIEKKSNELTILREKFDGFAYLKVLAEKFKGECNDK